VEVAAAVEPPVTATATAAAAAAEQPSKVTSHNQQHELHAALLLEEGTSVV
jgi:hypothetical protein